NKATLHVQSRADLVKGESHASVHLEAMHLHPAAGAARLALAIREPLVPVAALTDPAPWNFQVPAAN
ncbi:MAG: hypothetical protein NTV94_16050, partial [Planctomycetota bacterium]|nr:hypothetical protein [Planctomycetota bacterium]